MVSRLARFALTVVGLLVWFVLGAAVSVVVMTVALFAGLGVPLAALFGLLVVASSTLGAYPLADELSGWCER